MANLPQVGLEAVIAGMPQFNAAAGQITKAFDAINNKSSSIASSVSADFVGLGQGVLRFGALAGGAALVGVAALGAGIAALGASALTEVAKFERMELSIQNLVAREISGGKLIEQAVQSRITLSKKESEELERLQGNLDNEANSKDILTARIEEQKERIRQLTAQYGDQGLVVIKERAELQGMELDLRDLNKDITDHQGRISELTGKQGELVTTLEKVRVGQMSMSDAMAQATPRAQELIKWIQLLAIQSPFTSEGIQSAFQTALAYGFTTEQAQRLTKAEVDFVAATGRSAQSADLIALALGQIQSRGKLSAQELRQLSEQGVGTNRILEDMGFSLDDVTNGLVDTDVFIEAVLKDMEVFKGSAKDQATTFSGLISSLSEIKSIGLREFFTGTFEAIRPSLATFVNFLTNAALQTGDIRALGDALGQSVGGAIEKIAGWIRTIQTLGMGSGLTFFTQMFGPQGIALWGQVSDLISNISASFTDMGTSLSSITPTLSELAANIIPAITEALTFVNEHFEEFKGALLGIGGVLAVGVFAALVAGILSLLTPINLIIAGTALLGAAWVGNWGGIQDIVLGTIDRITEAITAFQAGGLFGGGSGSFGSAGLLASLGLDTTTIGTIQNSINTIIAVIQTAGVVLSAVWAGILQGIQPVIISFGELGATFASLGINWQTVGQALLQATGIVFSAIGVMILGLVSAVIGLVAGVTAGINTMIGVWTSLVPAIQQNILGITQYITGFIDFFNAIIAGDFTAAGQAISLIWLGIQNTTQGAFNTITTIIGGALKVVISIFKGFFDSVVGFWEGFYDTLVGHSIVYDIIDGIVNAFKDTDWMDLGAGIIDGILKGINDNVTKVYEKLKDMAVEALRQAGQAIGFGSPATKFIPLGASIPQGIAAGINSAASLVTDAIGGLMPGSFDQLLGIDRTITDPLRIAGAAFDDLEKHLDRILGGGKGQVALDLIKPIIKSNIAAIMASANPMAAIQNLLKTSGINFEKLGLGGLFSDKGGVGNIFWASFMENMDEAKAALQEMFIEAGRTAITIGQRLTGVIGGAVDVLNSRVERLQGLVAAGGGQFEGRILDAVQAQQLLNEALEEQAAIQDDILATKENEQKLNFLQQQLDLFDTIRQAGLDVGDVLGGLTLGLDASIPDLIAATNAVIEAMINQVNADLGTITGAGADIGDALVGGVTGSLGIDSPSKVMRALADNTMGSFLSQMMAWGPAVASAGSAAIAGPSLVAAPAMATAGGSQTTINANFGNNSINSGMDEAQFDSMVLRSIQRLMR